MNWLCKWLNDSLIQPVTCPFLNESVVLNKSFYHLLLQKYILLKDWKSAVVLLYQLSWNTVQPSLSNLRNRTKWCIMFNYRSTAAMWLLKDKLNNLELSIRVDLSRVRISLCTGHDTSHLHTWSPLTASTLPFPLTPTQWGHLSWTNGG